MRNALETTGNIAVHMEDRTSQLKDKNLEMTQKGERTELEFKKTERTL